MCDTPNTASEEHPITPNRPLRNGCIWQGTWNTLSIENHVGGALMYYFGTNNRLLIYALCVILPTGQWGTPHYSQPTTEEWLHLTAIWGTWNTLNIENHVWGAWCVISVCVIFLTGRPVRNTPLLPSGWGMDAFDSTLGHVNDNKHWKPFWGA